MRIKIALLAAATLFTTPAMAATVLFDNFDAEFGGATATNYVGFTNFNVVADFGAPPATTAAPTVDLLRQPNGFGLQCAGGAGSSCVDLDGSTGNGAQLITKNAFSFNAGDFVSLFIDVGGSQRGGDENFGMGFLTGGGLIQFNNYSSNFGPLGTGGPSNFSAGGLFTSASVPSAFPFTTFNVSFTAGNAGTLRAFAQTTSNDNVGPIIDNFRLNVTPGVPEPGTWALLVVGFGLVGGAMRRRPRQTARVSFA